MRLQPQHQTRANMSYMFGGGQQSLQNQTSEISQRECKARSGEKTNTMRDRTFRWRQIKTIDKSCNLDRVHLRGFKAMYLLEVRGLKRTKVAATAAAMKSSLCFAIICLKDNISVSAAAVDAAWRCVCTDIRRHANGCTFQKDF